MEGPSLLCDANYLNDKLGPAKKPLPSSRAQYRRRNDRETWVIDERNDTKDPKKKII